MVWSQSSTFVYGTTLVAFAATAIGVYFYKRKQTSWKHVGIVTNLFFHPVKSMRGIESKELLCKEDGICLHNAPIYDRGFLVVEADGNMLTARQEPRLVMISVDVNQTHVFLSAPASTTIQVEIPFKADKAMCCRVFGEETYGFDCGDRVSEWLSNYLDADYRLLFHPHNYQGRSICKKDERNASLFSGKGKIKYHDTVPVNLLSEASIEDLNTRLEKKLTERSFRPNILIGGCKPYEEDNWTFIRIGGATFQFVRYCSRCVLTTVDPDAGLKDKNGNPLKTLKEYRLCKPEDASFYKTNPLFGVALKAIEEGVIRVGDEVYAC